MKTNSAVRHMSAAFETSVRGMKKRRMRACYLTLAALMAAGAAPAATLTWDPGHTPGAPAGGAGVWDLAALNWSTGSVDQAWADVSATGTDTAVFGGTGGAVTLNTTLSALGLQFTTTGYTISGTGVLSVGSGGIDLSTLTSGNNTISNGIKLVADQTWNVGTGATLTTGALSGTGGLTKSGGGNVFTAGGTVAGVLNVAGGELGLSQDLRANGGLTGNGIIINTNGAVTQDKWFFVTSNSNSTFSGQILGGSSKLGLNTSGNGTLTLTGANEIDDAVTVNNGTLIFSGVHNDTTQTDTVGTVAGANAVLVLPAGVTFNSNYNAGQQYNASFNISNAATGVGVVKANGATILVNRAMNVGPTGFGAYTQTAGNASVGGFITVGGTSNGAVVNLTGGTLTMTGNSMTIGFGASNSYGVLNVGGNATMQMGTTPLGFGNGIWVGENGAAVMNVTGNGTVNVPADSITLANGATNGGNRVTSGILNLDGGVVTTNTITGSTGTGASTSILNFNGGTLKANIDTPNFIKNATTGSGVFNVFIYGGGATIDDGGHNVTIPQALSAPTGNGVSATGLSVSGGGFVDTPLVTITGGGGTGATAVANIDANGNLTGITITNPGTGYTSAPTFALLGGGVGNTGAISGTASLAANVGGGLTKQGAGTTTLSGTNTYSGATNITAGSLVLANGGSINGSSGVTINGGKLVQNSSSTLTPNITLTAGTLDGTGSVSNVTVANSAGAIISNGAGTAGALTAGKILFNGASTLNLTINSTSPALIASNITTSGGAITVNVNNLGVWTSGTFDLIQYSGLGGPGFADFHKGTIAGLGVRQAATLTNPAGFIALTVTGDAPKWSGAQDGRWTTAAISPQKNWQLITSGTPTDYIQGDVVLFDDSATGTTSVTISDANVSPTSVTFANSGKAYSIAGPFGIAGTGNVTISGGGTAALSAPSTYSGGTNLVNGVLAINGSSAIGTGALNITGGSIDNTSGAPVALTTANTINLQTDLTFAGTNNLNLGTGGLALTAARNFNMNGTAALTIGGTISGSFGINVQGTGTLVLTGNNTYNGQTTIHSGTLQIAGGTTGILSTSETNSIQISPGGSDSGTLVVSGGVLNADRVIIGGDSANTAGGNGKLIQTGGTINSQQWFTVGSGNAAGNTFPAGEFDMSGGTLNVIAQQMEVANFYGTTGTVNISGSAAIHIENNNLISMGANNLAGDGTINQNGGTVTFYSDGGTTVGGTGALYLGRSASLSGTYTYNLNGGTLTVPTVTATANSGGTSIFNFNGGTLKAPAANPSWMSGLSQANVQAGGAIIDDGGFAVTIPQNLNSGGGVDGGLTKLGNGTLTLTGSNGYTGPTVLNAGSLVVSGTGSLSGTNSVAVNAGTFLLSGTASINGSATVNVAGGKFVQASSTPLTAPVTVTSGTLTGSNATISSVLVPAGGGTVTNGNNDTGVLTIGTLTFSGTGSINPVLSGANATTSPGIMVTTLTTSGSKVTVNPFNATWNPGTYDLIGYSTLSGPGFGDFTLGTVTGLSPRQTAALANLPGEIALTISAGDVVIWTGASSNNWTTATIAPPKNWKLQSNGNTTDFISGDVVQFDDTATGSTNVNISDANVVTTSMTFNNSAKDYTISSTGGFGISGGFLSKNGTGNLTLNTANSYSGGTTLNAGKLNINTPTAIGTGVLTLNGGALDNTSGAAVTLTTNNLVSLNGDVAFAGTKNLSLGTGVVTIGGTAGARTITANAGTLSMGPVFGAAGYGLTIAGNGTVAIQTPDTGNGAPEQSTVAGELTVLPGATFAQGAADTFFGGLAGGGNVINGSNITRWMTVGMDNSNTTFSGTVSDGGTGGLGLRKRGTGTLTLTGSNGYSSSTTLESGAIVVNGGSSSMPGALIVGTATTTASFIMNSGSDAGGFVQVGGGANVSGAFLMTGGSLSTGGNEMWLATGDGGYGYMNMSGGSVTVGNWMALGRGGGQGVLDVSGNATLSITANNLTIGSFGGSGTDIHGVVTASGNATISSAGAVYVGENTPGVMTVSGNANVTALGGDGVMFSKNSATTGILNLNGGTMTTTKLTMNLAGTSTANFNGGTVKAVGDSAAFINNITNAVVYSGGITIDSNGHNVTVPQVFTAPAGSGVSAAGVTASGTGFLGEPVVVVSGGGGTGATAVANIDPNGNLVGITMTNPGTGYTSAPSFAILGGGLGSSGSIGGTATLVPNVGGALTKAGLGNVTLSGANTYSGGTSITGGTLIAANVHALGTGGVAVHANGTLRLQSGLSQSVVVPSLTFDGTPGAWTGHLDVTNDKMIVEATVSHGAAAALLESQAHQTMTSSTMAANYGVAVIDNGALTNPFSTFGGVPVDGNSILISAELLGDTNADGKVDSTDLNAVLSHFGAVTPAWTSGNFDGSATIDLTDLAYVLNNFNMTNPNASAAIPSSGNPSGAVATPEPTSLALLGLGAVALVRRRRKA